MNYKIEIEKINPIMMSNPLSLSSILTPQKTLLKAYLHLKLPQEWQNTIMPYGYAFLKQLDFYVSTTEPTVSMTGEEIYHYFHDRTASCHSTHFHTILGMIPSEDIYLPLPLSTAYIIHFAETPDNLQCSLLYETIVTDMTKDQLQEFLTAQSC